MTPIITIAGLSFAYGRSPQPVLRDVDLCIQPGETVLLVGPSGGGKSTLLRCINGLIPHFHGGTFSGAVTVGGIDTRGAQPRQLAAIAGMVFQDPESQKVARTVEEEIVFALENTGAPRPLLRKRLEESIDAVGIGALRGREMATLSGGELQRVAIAGALTLQPKVLLLDEPTSQLDPQAADDVLRTVRDLRDDHGLTVLIAEHRLERTVQFADRLALVSGDGTVQLADPRDAIRTLAGAPPVALLARALDWPTVPLSVAEARRYINGNAPPAIEPAAARAAPGAVAASLRGVHVTLGANAALRDITIDLHEGEITFLMGRNGAGKTTLLRTLAGVLAPQRGAVTPAAEATRESRYRNLAYVAQDPAAVLYQPLVEREIDDVLGGTGRDGSTKAELASWQLAHLAGRDPRDLSGGERQRLAIAAMLAGAPNIILLDEPTRGMDAAAKDLLIANLRQRRDAGATVVVACHDVELAARCADRVILLAEGEVIADGAPADVLTNSRTFATQANKLFGGAVLTVDDALLALRGSGA